MVKAVGTDSGTRSYDIFGFDDETNEIFVDEAIPRSEMVKDPSIVLKRLRKIVETYKVDAVVASSGYGIPLKLAKDASDEEIALATFISEDEARKGHRIIGLRKLLKMIKEDPVLREVTWFTPGVVQLPTVPLHRKLNRIDLGTSDKVYTAALAIVREAEYRGVRYNEVDVIAIEIGFAYTSALAIRNGEIVDAMAGTAGFPGYLGMGFMDAELAYAIANCVRFAKETLFRGGAAYASDIDPFTTPIEVFAKVRGVGYELMLESIAKDVLVLLYSVTPKTIYLSGRFTRVPQFLRDVTDNLSKTLKRFGVEAEVKELVTRGRVAKQAAEGAAIIANGLAGGKYKEIVDVLKLRESRGTIFDYVTCVDREALIKTYSKYID